MSDRAYEELQEKYGGRFVALRDGKVVAAGQTYRDLLASVRQVAVDRAELTFEYVEPLASLRAS
jgi:hypothetical protein